jgi:hypothetical protein
MFRCPPRLPQQTEQCDRFLLHTLAEVTQRDDGENSVAAPDFCDELPSATSGDRSRHRSRLDLLRTADRDRSNRSAKR